MDQVQQIVNQIAEVARTAAINAVGVKTGTVIGRAADGSVIVDDGSGGCTILASFQGAPQQCGAQVVLSLDTNISTQKTVCPVSFSIVPSGKTTLPDTRPVAPPPSLGEGLGDGPGGGDGGGIAMPPAAVESFATAPGDIYVVGDFTFNDLSYGYVRVNAGSLDTYYVGAAPSYNNLEIGHYNSTGPAFAGNFGQSLGNSGPVESGNNIVRGIGSSSGKLFGLEVAEDAVGGAGDIKIVIRDAATFAIIAENAATFLRTWLNANAPIYAATYATAHPNYHVSADPIDGSFWISLNCVNSPPPDFGLTFDPIWNISATDGSMLSYFEIPQPGSAIARAEWVVQLVRNGNFELGENGDWTVSDAGMIFDGSGHPHLTSYGATGFGALGEVTTGTHFVQQLVFVPTTMTTATLEFWAYSEGNGSGANETLVAQIRDAAGVAVLQTLVTIDNSTSPGNWVRYRYDISAYIGVPITIYFEMTETQADYTSGVVLDDVRIIS